MRRLQRNAMFYVSAGLLVLAACTPAAPPTSPTSTAGPTSAINPPQPAAAPTPSAPPNLGQVATAAPQGAAKPGAAPKPTGEVVYAIENFNSEIWDPSKTVRLGPNNGALIYELLYLPWPPNGEIRPYLLESGTMAEDSLSWTFKLKDGIRFSNGDPMTSEDVQFTLARFRSNDSTSTVKTEFQQYIKDVQIVDRLTVRVLLNQPWVTMPVYLAGIGNEGIVLPKKYIEQVGWEEFNRRPIGSGAYRLTEHKPGESMTFEAVENHWSRSPRFAKVRLVIVPEERARIAMLESGQADIIAMNPDSKREVDQKGFTTKVFPYLTNWRIQLTGAQSQYPATPIQKLEVRKALTLALDKQAMLNGLYAGAGEVAQYGISFPRFTLGAPILPPTPYDPAEAKRLLAAAGYPNGFDITLNALNVGCTTSVSRKFAEATAAYWQQVGVRTEIRQLEYNPMRPKFVGPQFAPDIVGQAHTFCTSGSQLGVRDLSAFYWGKGTFKSTDVADAEIEAAQKASTMDELVRQTEAAFKKVYDNYSMIAVLNGGLVYGFSAKTNFVPVTAGWDNIGFWLVHETP